MSVRVRFSRWTGSRDPFGPDVDVDSVLDEVGDDLLDGLDLDRALQRLQRRGLGSRAGLAELRRRVEEARRRELDRFGLTEPLQRIAEELEAILDRERTALDFHADEAEAAERRSQLDALPADVASRLSALEDYQWTDRRAEADYRALRERLRQEVAEATFGRLAQALGSASPEDLERMREMLADLNRMIAERARGEEPDFDAFKQTYGDLLPVDPQTLDELLDELARRMAAMSRMMASLDAEQRAQLAELAEQALGESSLDAEAAQLRQALQQAYPELGWDQPSDAPAFAPQGGGSLSDTVDWLEHLQEHEDLAEQLRQDYPGARLDDVDDEALRRLLGEEAAGDLQALREIERELERAGAARRDRGEMSLTPQGIRRLGQRSLTRIYGRTTGLAAGGHQARRAGGEGEPTGATRTWQFGDPLRLDVARTVANAVQRRAADSETAAGAPVRLTPDDFAVVDAERRVRTTTVLLLDMSFSMPLRGNWVPAKKVALALHALVAGQYPEDRFHIVGFSDYARRLAPTDLLAAGWERVYGTNMEHAFRLTRRLLSADPGADAHVLMVTDGEPTAHLEGDTPVFAWPPEPETLQRTMVEASRLARAGVTLNVFLLDHDPGAAQFVEQMVRRVGGRILYPDLDDLGSVVVRDFLRHRG